MTILQNVSNMCDYYYYTLYYMQQIAFDMRCEV
jgi:hypothetical protein